MRMRHLILICGLACQATLAAAEGAVQVLSCTATTTCDAQGSCTAASDEVTFTLTPVQVDADGAGQFTIAYGDVTAEMGSLSLTGPFVWAEGETDTQNLMVSGPASLIWVRQDRSAPDATTLFLTCKDPA